MPATSVAPFSCPARQSDLIYVAGRLAYRTWAGKDGQPRHGVEIVAHDLVLLDRRPPAGGGDAADQPAEGGDALPF